MYSLEECCSLIEEQIARLNIGVQAPSHLYEPIGYVLKQGGKRIRPAMTLMACNLFSNELQQAVMPAVAIEVFHNFTLLHDDVMDKADIRRNQPTVHKKWSENVAILSGDAMQVLAYQYLGRSREDLLPSLLPIFSDTALQVCEGQQYDMNFETTTDVSIDEYRHMITLKTAVLLAASLKIGAICGGADKQNAETLYRFGISLGLTFQILDDWLDVYSDPKVFGKATGGDILTAKKTFLLITALERADADTRAKLLALLNNRDIADEDKINQVKAIYDKLDVNKTVQQTIDEYYIETMQHLQKVQIADASRKDELKKLAGMLLKRNK
ncbi:MAG: polyprenyl synthetase family protein [Bacteroidales bacterium]|jgi:geranylgeranyl diphosphate synthase type II|nr:polyprenyl synthetase family protein [Bacteroidales bacterium]